MLGVGDTRTEEGVVAGHTPHFREDLLQLAVRLRESRRLLARRDVTRERGAHVAVATRFEHQYRTFG